MLQSRVQKEFHFVYLIGNFHKIIFFYLSNRKISLGFCKAFMPNDMNFPYEVEFLLINGNDFSLIYHFPLNI